jgi:cytochrome P450
MTASVRPDAATIFTPPAPNVPREPDAPDASPPFDPAQVDLHDPAYTRDPYAAYAQFRRAAPVAHIGAPYDSRWVFRHADVVAALQDTATFVKSPPGGPVRAPGIFGVRNSLPPGVFSADPPEHTVMRAAFEPPLRAAFAGASAVANALVDDFLAGLRASGTRRLELMADYAVRIPSATLFSVLGIPREHWSGIVGYVAAIAATNDPTQPLGVQLGGGTAVLALYFYCQTLVREAAAGPGDTVLAQMLARGLQAGLTPEHLQSTLLNLLVAGYLSTTFLIGTGVLDLLAHPHQLARLRADPSLIGSAVQEMLRYDSPAQAVDRVVAADTVLGGVPLAKGDKVTLVLGSANRDESVFGHAERFDITRPVGDPPVAVPFGGGIHACLGAPLVLHVAPIAIGRLVTELPDMALAGAVQWQTDPYLRAPANLPLVI